MAFVPNDAVYHETKTPIDFWCRQRLNPRSFIQPPNTLLVELTRTHKIMNIILLLETKY